MATALRNTTFTGVQVRHAVSARPVPVICTRIVARKVIQGKVTSDSMKQTVTVEVERYRTVRIYGKRIRVSKKYHVHDEEEKCEVGDIVVISSIPPMSKTKTFKIQDIVRKVVKL